MLGTGMVVPPWLTSSVDSSCRHDLPGNERGMGRVKLGGKRVPRRWKSAAKETLSYMNEEVKAHS